MNADKSMGVCVEERERERDSVCVCVRERENEDYILRDILKNHLFGVSHSSLVYTKLFMVIFELGCLITKVFATF
jgi:hypothetical protein